MESLIVKQLRDKYGIHDSRNEYTEEEIEALSKKKMYYLKATVSEYGEDSTIVYKHVYGYISSDKEPCVFIKDRDVAGFGDGYYPVRMIKRCKKLKEGIYFDSLDKLIFCTTDELEYCKKYLNSIIDNELKSNILELEKRIRMLKESNISTKAL